MTANITNLSQPQRQAIFRLMQAQADQRSLANWLHVNNRQPALQEHAATLSSKASLIPLVTGAEVSRLDTLKQQFGVKTVKELPVLIGGLAELKRKAKAALASVGLDRVHNKDAFQQALTQTRATLEERLKQNETALKTLADLAEQQKMGRQLRTIGPPKTPHDITEAQVQRQLDRIDGNIGVLLFTRGFQDSGRTLWLALQSFTETANKYQQREKSRLLHEDALLGLAHRLQCCEFLDLKGLQAEKQAKSETLSGLHPTFLQKHWEPIEDYFGVMSTRKKLLEAITT